MKTPKLYNDLINEKKITNEIIAECVYYVNKRAKNYRDKIKEYKNGRSHQHLESNIEKAEEEMGKYYQLKEEFLKVFTPNLIHKQFIGEKKKRVYSYEKNYEKLLKEKTNDIFWKNSYYDYDKDMEIEFFDYHLGTKKYLYFLYCEIGEHSFHSPVSEKIAESNTELEIQEIDENFKTHGSKNEGLLSMQFVKKVLELLQSEDYTIVD
jgi:hypothetical protein